MLISPAEPPKIKDLGMVRMLPEKYGADVLINKGIKVAIQRKEFPGDFLASLADGRLYDLLGKMHSAEDRGYRRVLLIEGYGQWTAEGELVSPIRDWQGFSYRQLVGVLATVTFESGMTLWWTRDINQTVQMLKWLEAWAGKKEHLSLYTRPGPEKDSFGRLTDKHRVLHVAQGLPGMGPKLARAFVEHFEGLPLTFTHSVEELMEVPGIGRKRAEEMVRVVEMVVEREGK